MKQRIRPLKASDCSKSDNVFRFRVYFDKLNQEQLGRLRWSLDFTDSRCAYKMEEASHWGLAVLKYTLKI